jgi:hypothetical protein
VDAGENCASTTLAGMPAQGIHDPQDKIRKKNSQEETICAALRGQNKVSPLG